MGRVGRSIELRRKHATTRAGFHHGRAIAVAVGKADPTVVPLAGALHQQRVNSIDSQRSHSLQNVGDGWSTRPRITVVVGHIRIQAADARTMPLLNEDVAAIAVTADPGENHRDTLETEMPAGLHPRWVVATPQTTALQSRSIWRAMASSRRNPIPRISVVAIHSRSRFSASASALFLPISFI